MPFLRAHDYMTLLLRVNSSHRVSSSRQAVQQMHFLIPPYYSCERASPCLHLCSVFLGIRRVYSFSIFSRLPRLFQAFPQISLSFLRIGGFYFSKTASYFLHALLAFSPLPHSPPYILILFLSSSLPWKSSSSNPRSPPPLRFQNLIVGKSYIINSLSTSSCPSRLTISCCNVSSCQCIIRLD